MDSKTTTQGTVLAPRSSNAADRRATDAGGPDAMGLWFAALALCAVLAAGVIVYQTGNSDLVTASNDATPTAGHGSAR